MTSRVSHLSVGTFGRVPAFPNPALHVLQLLTLSSEHIWLQRCPRLYAKPIKFSMDPRSSLGSCFCCNTLVLTNIQLRERF